MKHIITYYKNEKAVKTLNYECNPNATKSEISSKCLQFAKQNKPANYDYYEIAQA